MSERRLVTVHFDEIDHSQYNTEDVARAFCDELFAKSGNLASAWLPLGAEAYAGSLALVSRDCDDVAWQAAVCLLQERFGCQAKIL